MASMTGQVRFIRDLATETLLRAEDGAALTSAATTYYPASTGLSLGTLATAYWDNNEIPWDGIAADLVVTSIDVADTDETYTFSLEVATSSAFSSPIKVAEMTVRTTGPYKLVVDAETIEARVSGATHIRLKLVVAGTTPSIDFYGQLSHHGHR